jgi:SnoaL-like domain
MPEDLEQRLRRAYEAFNARDVEAALALMHSDVDWPNAIEGGRVHGHDGCVRTGPVSSRRSIRASNRFASRLATAGVSPSTCTRSSARSTPARSPTRVWSTSTHCAAASSSAWTSRRLKAGTPGRGARAPTTSVFSNFRDTSGVREYGLLLASSLRRGHRRGGSERVLSWLSEKFFGYRQGTAGGGPSHVQSSTRCAVQQQFKHFLPF